jgi:hypothetical protein
LSRPAAGRSVGPMRYLVRVGAAGFLGAIAACGSGAQTSTGTTTGTGGAGGAGSTASASNAASTSGTGSSGTTTTATGSTGATTGTGGSGGAIKTVFIILMENKQWSSVHGDTDAPYINNTLLPMGAHAENYHQPTGNHPSETNYIWLEAGTNLGITTDDPPATNHQSTTAHLVTQLDAAGISWKSYQEGIDGTTCPLADDTTTNYAVRHNPMVFFDDVTGNQDPNSAYCKAHVRPYSELAGDLAAGTVARYNFITPSLCHDMHGNGTGCLIPHTSDGDTWLSTEVPTILASQAYQTGGAIFLTWDECEQLEIFKCDDPIGMIVLSPFAKPGGYSNQVLYDHSSTVRTFQEIFGVGPMLAGAASATDLSDLFTTFP